MPIIEPDLTETSDFSPIPPDSYNARCGKVEVDTSKNGNPMIIVTNELEVNGKPRERKDWIVTSGKAAFKFEAFLRALDMNDEADALKRGEKVPIDTDLFIGATYTVVIEAATYNDAPSDQVKTYLASN